MASIDNALTTLSRAKVYMGITNTKNDTLITRLILGASSFVETYCRRKFARQVVVNERVNGRGISSFFCKITPIISGETFTLSARTTNSNEDSWENFESEDYFVNNDTGRVDILGTLYDGESNYRVSYTGGYYLPSHANYQDGTNDNLDLPYDLEQAVLDLVMMSYNLRKSKGVNREKVRDVEVTYMKMLKDDPTLGQTLNQYRKMRYY